MRESSQQPDVRNAVALFCFVCVCVCVRVCACVRACVRACVCVSYDFYLLQMAVAASNAMEEVRNAS